MQRLSPSNAVTVHGKAVVSCHSRAGGNPVTQRLAWTPACAGVTERSGTFVPLGALGLPLLLVLCWSAVGDAAYDVEAIRADAKFFTEASCSQLKAGVSAQDLAGFKSDLLKSVAAAMLEGTYDTTYRTACYEAYPSPSELGRTLKLGDGFSRYENITGIYLEAGEHVVLVGNTAGKVLWLLVPDWMRKPAPGVTPAKDPNGWGAAQAGG